jgi:hypothetical protein
VIEILRAKLDDDADSIGHSRRAHGSAAMLCATTPSKARPKLLNHRPRSSMTSSDLSPP